MKEFTIAIGELASEGLVVGVDPSIKVIEWALMGS